MSPSKARQVLDLIRGKSAVDAIRALSLVNREASEVVGKLLASAVANATIRYGLGADEVFVAAAFADEGPTIKRFRPRARGRATRIRKRSCHITIVVEEMPLEMRRIEAAKSSGRQSGRRAQRVASSRGAAQERETPAVEAEAANEQKALVEMAIEGVDNSNEAIIEVQATETQAIAADVVDAQDVESVPQGSGDVSGEALAVAEDTAGADVVPADVDEEREDS
jgi:large subunit ribosomal protein L22